MVSGMVWKMNMSGEKLSVMNNGRQAGTATKAQKQTKTKACGCNMADGNNNIMYNI